MKNTEEKMSESDQGLESRRVARATARPPQGVSELGGHRFLLEYQIMHLVLVHTDRGAGAPITPINVRVVRTSPNFGAELLPRPWSPGRAEGILVTAVDSALL